MKRFILNILGYLCLTRKLKSNESIDAIKHIHCQPNGGLCGECVLKMGGENNVSFDWSKECWVEALRWKVTNFPGCNPKYPMYNTGVPEIQQTMEMISNKSALMYQFDNKSGTAKQADESKFRDELLYGRFEHFYFNNVLNYPSRDFFQHVDDFARLEYIRLHFEVALGTPKYLRRNSHPNFSIQKALSSHSHVPSVGIVMGHLNVKRTLSSKPPRPFWVLPDDPWDYN